MKDCESEGLKNFCWTGVFSIFYYSAAFVLLVSNAPQFHMVYLWPFLPFFFACDWSSTVAVSRADAAGGSPVKQAPRRNGRVRPNEVSKPAAAIVPPPVSGGGRERVPPRVLSVLCCRQSPLLGPHKSHLGIRWTSPFSLVASRTQRVVSSLFWLYAIAIIFLDSQSSCKRLGHFLFFPLHFCHSAPVSDVPQGSQQLFVPFFPFLLLVFAQCPVPLFFAVFSNLWTATLQWVKRLLKPARDPDVCLGLCCSAGCSSKAPLPE